MALQGSGAISLLDIATEFGGSTPHSMSEYAAEVGKTATAGQNIGFNEFWGTSSFGIFSNATVAVRAPVSYNPTIPLQNSLKLMYPSDKYYTRTAGVYTYTPQTFSTPYTTQFVNMSHDGAFLVSRYSTTITVYTMANGTYHTIAIGSSDVVLSVNENGTVIIVGDNTTVYTLTRSSTVATTWVKTVVLTGLTRNSWLNSNVGSRTASLDCKTLIVSNTVTDYRVYDLTNNFTTAVLVYTAPTAGVTGYYVAGISPDGRRAIFSFHNGSTTTNFLCIGRAAASGNFTTGTTVNIPIPTHPLAPTYNYQAPILSGSTHWGGVHVGPFTHDGKNVTLLYSDIGAARIKYVHYKVSDTGVMTDPVWSTDVVTNYGSYYDTEVAALVYDSDNNGLVLVTDDAVDVATSVIMLHN